MAISESHVNMLVGKNNFFKQEERKFSVNIIFVLNGGLPSPLCYIKPVITPA